MKNFKDTAKKAVAHSFITVGREAIATDMVIAGYPNGITIIAADLLTVVDKGVEKTYAACLFAEDNAHYINGGKSLTDIVTEWLDGYDSAEAMSADLKASGGVKVKLAKKMTRDGRQYTEVTILD